MQPLSLSVLGPPVACYTGKVIKFRTRKQFALLIYLAVEGGMHSREKLLTLLWPESDAAHGRMLLRRTLTLLRQLFEQTVHEHFLLSEHDLIGLVPGAVELDLTLLNDAFERLRLSPHPETLDANASRLFLSQLRAVRDLSRAPFLEGFALSDAANFDTWMSTQRATIERRLDLILDRLCTLQIAVGETLEAIETASCWISCAPLHETAVQRLMQLYLAAGNRTSAIEQYEAYHTRLAQELQAQPGLEIRRLAERIRSMQGTLTVSEVGRPASQHCVWAEKPLVGRAREHTLLVEAFDAVRTGQLRLVLVEGEAGIGKTRLVSNFLNWAAAQGADVVQGQAFETGGQLPYQPLIDALRPRLERENAPEDLLTDTWLAELSRILPELRDRYPDLPQPLTDEVAAQTRLHEAVARLCQAIATRAPFILWLDDVQWADTASLALVSTLVQHFHRSAGAALFILCTRSEALLKPASFSTWIKGIERSVMVNRLAPELLTREETRLLVHRLLIPPAFASEALSPVEEQFSCWLFKETQGQPFYISETLKALLERKILVSSVDADGLPVIDLRANGPQIMGLNNFLPAGVRDVIRTRIMQLTLPAQSLLIVGAVLGHGFSFETLCQVAGIDEMEALEALDEIVAHHLWREQQQKCCVGIASNYSFVHDKIREVVYSEAGEARRRVLHRRAFEFFQRAYHNGHGAPAVLAYHARAAGLNREAFCCSIAAGDGALQVFAVHDALTAYEQARLILNERLPAVHPETPGLVQDVQHLYLQLGRAYELINDVAQAHTIYQEQLSYARETGTRIMEVEALNQLATLMAQETAQREQALALLQEAQQCAGVIGDRAGLAKTEWNLAQISYYAFDIPAALHHGNIALGLAEELQLPDLQARSLNALAYSNRSHGDWSEATKKALQARDLYRALGNRAMEADCLGVLTDLQISDGLLTVGIETARAAYAISQQLGNPWGMVSNALHLARGLLETGEYEEALAVAQQSVVLARTLPLQLLLLLTLTTLGAIQRGLFQFEQAYQAHREAREIEASWPSRRYAAHCLTELCADEAMMGNWQAACCYAQQAQAVRDPAVLIWVASPLWLETEALMRAGHVQEAQQDVQRWSVQAQRRPRLRIAYLRAHAVLEDQMGNGEQALGYLQCASRMIEEIGLPGERWRVYEALGQLYDRLHAPEQAQQAYAQVRATLTNLAERIQDEVLRRQFLQSPQMRTMLSGQRMRT